MVLSRLDNQLIGPQAMKRFVQNWPVDIRVCFGVERRRVKGLDIFVVQGLDLVQPGPIQPARHAALGTRR